MRRAMLGALLLGGAVLLAVGWWRSRGPVSDEPAARDGDPHAGAATSPKGHLALVAILGEPTERPAVQALCVSPDGAAIAAGDGSGTLRLWDVETRTETRTLFDQPVVSLAWSPDGAYIAVGADTSILMWSVASARVEVEFPRRLTGNRTSQGDLAFSPDGRRLYAGAGHESVDAWDLFDGREPRTLQGVEPMDEQWEGPITSSPIGGSTTDRVAVMRDGASLVAADWTYPLRVVDTASGQLVRMLRGHQKHLVSIAVSPDSRRLASSSGDAAFLWTTDRWEGIAFAAAASLLGWSADSTRVFSAGLQEGTLRVWDARSGALCDSIALGSEPKSLVVHDGNIAVGCADGTIRRYEHRP